jgi:hypothetical protein
MIVPERTTLTTITFLRPFSLTDVDGVQPAGTYTVETIDRTLDNLSFIAYRRVSTAIMLPAVGASARQRQTIFIDPLELAVALKQDVQNRGEPGKLNAGVLSLNKSIFYK